MPGKKTDFTNKFPLREAKSSLKKVRKILTALKLSEANKLSVEMGLQQAAQHMEIKHLSQQHVAKALKQTLQTLQGEEEFEAIKADLQQPLESIINWLGDNWRHLLYLLKESSPDER